MSEWEVITGLLAGATERPTAERRRWLRATGHPAEVIDEALLLLNAWEPNPVDRRHHTVSSIKRAEAADKAITRLAVACYCG